MGAPAVGGLSNKTNIVEPYIWNDEKKVCRQGTGCFFATVAYPWKSWRRVRALFAAAPRAHGSGRRAASASSSSPQRSKHSSPFAYSTNSSKETGRPAPNGKSPSSYLTYTA